MEGKKGRKKEFVFEEKHITIEHKLDHQYEGIVVRVIGFSPHLGAVQGLSALVLRWSGST